LNWRTGRGPMRFACILTDSLLLLMTMRASHRMTRHGPESDRNAGGKRSRPGKGQRTLRINGRATVEDGEVGADGVAKVGGEESPRVEARSIAASRRRWGLSAR
jgi:hypothetical protein